MAGDALHPDEWSGARTRTTTPVGRRYGLLDPEAVHHRRAGGEPPACSWSLVSALPQANRLPCAGGKPPSCSLPDADRQSRPGGLFQWGDGLKIASSRPGPGRTTPDWRWRELMASGDSTFLPQDVDYLGFLEAQLRDMQGIETLAYELIQNADDVQAGESEAGPPWIAFDV